MYMHTNMTLYIYHIYTYIHVQIIEYYTCTVVLYMYMYSLLPRIFRVVVGFYIALSAIYPVYTVYMYLMLSQ